MKICVVCQKYPSDTSPEVMAFVHARNLFYREAGHTVHVLNFSAPAAYTYAGIEVRDAANLDDVASYDVFVFHSPNLRRHVPFLLKHRRAIRGRVFIAHGHEFISWNARAGQPYDFLMTTRMRLRFVAVKLYDRVKIAFWSRYLRRAAGTGLQLIFVSRWLRGDAEDSLGLRLDDVARIHVVNNPVHPVFLERSFDPAAPKVADFVTIRPLDERKYAVDVVAEVARRHPQYTFHLFGHGRYFDHHDTPPNLSVFKQQFKQADLPALFDRYRAALLPTRWDSQGVLMCEMATYGMPVWVSDLPVCRDMIGVYPNARFFDNARPQLGPWPESMPLPPNVKSRFGFGETVRRELAVLEAARSANGDMAPDATRQPELT